jgi:hypothetical protein
MPLYMPSPETLNNGDYSAIKAKKDSDYQNNQSVWNVFWTRANLNVRLESGDPTILNNWGNNGGLNVATIGSSSYYMNRARPIGLMLSGYQRRNRKSTVIQPLENGDNFTAGQFTKLTLNIYKRQNVYELISEAFHEGAIISGMNMIQVYLNFTNDPLNGEFGFRNLAYNEFMIDPYFREPDLSDAGFIMIRSYLSKPAIASIMPPSDYERVMALQGNQQGSTVDGRFQYEAAARGYSMAPKLAYDEYYYRDYRKQKKLYDTFTGESIDISDRDDIDISQLIADNPQVIVQEKLIPTVRLCITIQDTVFYDGPNPLGLDRYPFVPVLGFYNKSLPYMYNRFQSVMTSLISPQLLFNRRIILNMDFIESVVNSGYIFKQGSVLDAKHLLQTGQGKLIPIKDNFNPVTDVVPIQPPQIPPSYFQQLEVLDKELFNVVGLSQENLGKVVEDDASGYQTALRTAAGLTAQQPIFDRLDLSQNMLGNLVMDIIQLNWTPGKVKQMLGGQEPAPQFYDKAFGKYHCVVELGFNTETQQQMEFGQLLMLRNAGIAIPDSQMIKKATLQGKDELLQEMAQQQQQQQQSQQLQQQIQMQDLQSRAELNKAYAYSQVASGNERNSRVAENRALAIQKIHEGNRQDEAAELDKVRALKELHAMDLADIHKLIAISNILKASEQKTVAEETKDVLQSQSNQLKAQESPGL